MKRSRPLLVHLLREEQKRNASLSKRYEKALGQLPKGRLYVRRVEKGRKIKRYVYLSRRLPGQRHPESKYIGSAGSDEVHKVKLQLKDREQLEAQLAHLAIEKQMIEKALAEYRRLSCI